VSNYEVEIMSAKHILITGGSGFLGQALIAYWLQQQHQLSILSRYPDVARRMLPPQVNVVGNLEELTHAQPLDAVINLAGEPIFGKRWSSERKELIRDSRIAFTQKLITFISSLAVKPQVLLSGSAIGVYGDQGDVLLTEASVSSTADFPQSLCQDWEQTALQAEQLGVRVCLIRTGLVLDSGGGLLQRMLPAFRLGLGGQLGHGGQWMSWIHRRDWVAIADLLLNNPELHGAFNATAPQPVTNLEFSRCLAKQLQRPMLLPLPARLLKTLFGEMSELMLGSQRVIPERLLKLGFEFQFNALETALKQILENKH
jgi:uncharacterized protein (TIGR01777 family)